MEPLLRSDPEGELSATTILEWLDERYSGRFGSSQLRTLQRRIRDYRALHGPDREVYFQQDHPPGREAQVDFTHCSGLGVTIGGEPFRHLLFHLRGEIGDEAFFKTLREYVSQRADYIAQAVLPLVGRGLDYFLARVARGTVAQTSTHGQAGAVQRIGNRRGDLPYENR